jgi:lipopolysaccharide transport system permease protein
MTNPITTVEQAAKPIRTDGTAEPRDAVPGSNGSKPLLKIRGGRGRASLQSLRELWLFREVLWAFAVRSVKVKYKQAAVGVGWVVVQPLVSAALFALFLGKLADVPSEGIPYLLFALAGMTVWTYFSAAAGSAMGSLVEDQVLLRKVYFPREVIPIAAVVAGLVDFFPALLALVIAAIAYGVLPGIQWLALPAIPLLLVLAAAAFGLATAAINVYYRDVRYALPFVLQLGLFVSPVVYSLSEVPEPWRTPYAILNPVAAAIDGTRKIVTHGKWPDPLITFGALGWTALALILAYAFFKRVERGFSDRV